MLSTHTGFQNGFGLFRNLHAGGSTSSHKNVQDNQKSKGGEHLSRAQLIRRKIPIFLKTKSKEEEKGEELGSSSFVSNFKNMAFEVAHYLDRITDKFIGLPDEDQNVSEAKIQNKVKSLVNFFFGFASNIRVLNEMPSLINEELKLAGVAPLDSIARNDLAKNIAKINSKIQNKADLETDNLCVLVEHANINPIPANIYELTNTEALHKLVSFDCRTIQVKDLNDRVNICANLIAEYIHNLTYHRIIDKDLSDIFKAYYTDLHSEILVDLMDKTYSVIVKHAERNKIKLSNTCATGIAVKISMKTFLHMMQNIAV